MYKSKILAQLREKNRKKERNEKKQIKNEATTTMSTVRFVVSEEEFVRSKQILINSTDSDDFDDVQNMQNNRL